MKKYLFLLLFAAIALNACKSKVNNHIDGLEVLTIDVDNAKLYSDEPALQLCKYVKLETKNECLLEDVKKVVTYKNMLFLLSNWGGNVMAFDDAGKFIFRINKGKGPNEVISVTDIAVDEANEHLLVLDRYKITKVFDFSGKFIKQLLSPTNAIYLQPLGKDLLFFDSYMNQASDYFISLTNNSKTIKEAIHKVPNSSKMNFIMPNPFAPINQESTYIFCLFTDTIYIANTTSPCIQPKYVMDFKGKSANTPKNLENINRYKEYREMARNNHYVSGTSNFFAKENRLFFDIGYDNNYFVTYNLKTNLPTLHTRLLNGLPQIYTASGQNKDYIIFRYDIIRLLKYFKGNPEQASDDSLTRELRKTCTNEEDNPILVFCTFR